METNFLNIFNLVKSDFCSLINYKIRGSTIEIITGVSTLTNRYVSVFLSMQSGKYIVSDGGWINKQYYDNETSLEDIEIFERVENQYRIFYDVKEVLHKDGIKYYFKSTDKKELISVMVHDISQ